MDDTRKMFKAGGIFLFVILIYQLTWAGTSDLIYSTFLGGNEYDNGNSLTLDSAGNVYITGFTGSTNFPASTGAYDKTYNNSGDAFVAKLNPAGTSFIYITFLGGDSYDEGDGIKVDDQGNVYISGYTASSANFPVSPGAYRTVFNGGTFDAFVTKLNSTGSALIYSTFLGGNDLDFGYSLAIDSVGNAYISGATGSTNFPVTSNAFDTVYNGGPNFDGFITKLNSSGTGLVFSTYIGGGDDEGCSSIVTDSAGNIYATGFTASADFPVTASSYDTSFNGGIFDAFILKLNPTGTNLLYSTFLGGSGNENIYDNSANNGAIALDSSGNVYVTGFTDSSDFPVTAGAFDTSYNSGSNGDAFVTKLNSTGSALLYSTYLGGSGDDGGYSIAVDTAGNSYVTGFTQSSNFPISPGVFDTTYNGGIYDAFVTKLDSAGSTLLYSTFIGGNAEEAGYSIKIDTTGNAYITGYTNSSTTFPILGGCYDTTYNDSGNYSDVYIVRLNTLSFPPQLTKFPNLKLFINTQTLSPAFDIQDYLSNPPANSYSIPNNFLSLSTLTGSKIYQGSYGLATTGTSIYSAGNLYGNSNGTTKIKYSTYKIQKLPKTGLNPGSSTQLNITNYTLTSLGSMPPPSFGNNGSLTISDNSKINASWLSNSILQITSLGSFTGVVYVDIIASPNSSPPYGADMDKERIQVYTNLLPQSTFSTANDTSNLGFELAPGARYVNMASLGWVTAVADYAGTVANGVLSINFADGSTGIKATPFSAYRVFYSAGQWYTALMRVFSPNTSNSHQTLLFNFSNDLAVGGHIDVSAIVLFGSPTTWTWVEAPLYSNETGTGFPQFQFKGGSAGTIYIDDIQIINSSPTLVDANRANTRLRYPYGDFDLATDTTGWGQQVYTGAGSAPAITVLNGELRLDFNGAGNGSSQKGIKWTANNNSPGNVYTPSNPAGHEVGVRVSLTKESGNFNTLSALLLLAAYGVQNNGQGSFGVVPSDLIAYAEYGRLTDGVHRAISTALNGYHQFQFGIKNSQAGVMRIDNVDFDLDNDDPNFGDGNLYP